MTSHDRLAKRPNDPPLLILTSLAGGDRHGYALSQDIESFAGVTLSPGALYGAITRLEERGLIEPVGSDSRRTTYRITTSGRAALVEELRQMRSVVSTATARLGELGMVS